MFLPWMFPTATAQITCVDASAANMSRLNEAVPILKQTATGLTFAWNDRWGTPFIVHPLGTGMLELRCAGPDRTAYTEDDLILQPDRVLRHGDADANRGSSESPGR